MHGKHEPFFCAGLQVATAESCFRFMPRAVHQPSAVWRNCGPESRAITRRDRSSAPVLAIVNVHLIARQRSIVLPVAGCLREVEIARVRTEGCADHLCIGDVARNLCSTSATRVEEPQL